MPHVCLPSPACGEWTVASLAQTLAAKTTTVTPHQIIGKNTSSAFGLRRAIFRKRGGVCTIDHNHKENDNTTRLIVVVFFPYLLAGSMSILRKKTLRFPLPPKSRQQTCPSAFSVWSPLAGLVLLPCHVLTSARAQVPQTVLTSFTRSDSPRPPSLTYIHFHSPTYTHPPTHRPARALFKCPSLLSPLPRVPWRRKISTL